MPETVTKKVARKPAKPIGRYITRREAVEAFNRLRTSPDGSRYVIRFSLGQRVEHMILTLSFTMLGITGLAQTFYETLLGGGILNFFGGIDGTRQIHHMFAFLFGAQSIYHVWVFLYDFVVHRHVSKIWPDLGDVIHLLQMLRLNLGVTKEHPFFDRYTFEEKAEYWALVWGTAIMGFSGLVQWFPVLVTEIMPGWAIPAARALHKWEAILAVLAILTWHFYHVVLKQFNKSIFTGTMTIKEMEEEHPAELLYLGRAAAVVRNTKWPVFIEMAPVVVKTKPEEPSNKVRVSQKSEIVDVEKKQA